MNKKKSNSLENLKQEFIHPNFENFNFDKGFNLKKSQSLPDIQLEIKLKKTLEEMTIIEDMQSLVPTNGVKNLKKFIDLTDIIYAKQMTNVVREKIDYYILTKLEGKAYDIAINLQDKQWPSIKAALENAFSDKESISNLHTKLTNCVQQNDESVFEFSVRIKEIVRKLSEAYKRKDENMVFYDDDSPIFTAFEEGLIDPNIRVLIKATANTFDEAVETAIQEEFRKKNKIAKEVLTQKKCSFCNSETHTFSDCIKFQKENNICKLCHKVGHFNSECNFKEQKQMNSDPKFSPNFQQYKTNNYRNVNYQRPQNGPIFYPRNQGYNYNQNINSNQNQNWDSNQYRYWDLNLNSSRNLNQGRNPNQKQNWNRNQNLNRNENWNQNQNQSNGNSNNNFRENSANYAQRNLNRINMCRQMNQSTNRGNQETLGAPATPRNGEN